MAKWLLLSLILYASAALCQTNARQVASSSSGGKSDTDQKIASLQLKVKTAPGDYAAMTNLARRFFKRRGRPATFPTMTSPNRLSRNRSA